MREVTRGVPHRSATRALLEPRAQRGDATRCDAHFGHADSGRVTGAATVHSLHPRSPRLSPLSSVRATQNTLLRYQTDNPIPRSRPGPGPPMTVMGIHTHHIACELQLPQFPTSQGPPGSPKAVLPASNCQPRPGTGGRSTRPGEKLAASVAERVFGWWD